MIHMFIQADLGDDAASRGIGGTEYLGRADSCVDPDPPREEPAVVQVVVDQDWPANVRRRPTATVQHLRARLPMNAY